jgi:hypothetical protein
VTDRDTALAGFVAASGWAGAAMSPLAGDASARSYRRLRRGADRAVLMDAPPDRCGPVAPFLRMSAHLAALGLSAPRVLSADPPLGAVLLEDLGDADFIRVLDGGIVPEQTLYLTAIEALHAMQRDPPPADLDRWTAAHMAEVTRPAFDEGPGGPAGFDRWRTALADSLQPLDQAALVLCHRDFHAGNLFWLPDRAGPARVGIIDHQDAFAGHPAYDLVSLITDARRDLAPGLPDVLVRRWLDLTGGDAATLDRDRTLLSLQRNLRVHGVLTRLARTGRPQYAAFLPRVRAHLRHALAALPALAPLAREVMP